MISIKEGNSLPQYSHLVPDWAHSISTYFQKMNLGEVFRPFLKRAWYRVEKFQVWYLWYDICMQIDKVPSQSKGSRRHRISLWQIWQGFCFQKGTANSQARIFFILSTRIPEWTLRFWKDFRTINIYNFFNFLLFCLVWKHRNMFPTYSYKLNRPEFKWIIWLIWISWKSKINLVNGILLVDENVWIILDCA